MNAYLEVSMMLAAITLASCARPAAQPPLEAPRARPKPTLSSTRAAPSSPATLLAARCTGSRCDFDLSRNYASFDQPHEVLIDPCMRRNLACTIHAGWLTQRGRQTFAALRDTLAASELAELYGCPGCADGPTYGIVLPGTRGAAPSHHRYDPARLAEYPEPLREAHAIFEGVRQSVLDCVSSELVEIVGTCERTAQ